MEGVKFVDQLLSTQTHYQVLMTVNLKSDFTEHAEIMSLTYKDRALCTPALEA